MGRPAPDQDGTATGLRSTDAHAPSLPPGPVATASGLSRRLRSDPFGALLSARAVFGDVFTLRLADSGPVVVLADPVAASELEGRAEPVRAPHPAFASGQTPTRRLTEEIEVGGYSLPAGTVVVVALPLLPRGRRRGPSARTPDPGPRVPGSTGRRGTVAAA